MNYNQPIRKKEKRTRMAGNQMDKKTTDD